jgi:hypothetical protein
LGEKNDMIDPAPMKDHPTDPHANGYYGSPYIFGIDPIWQVNLSLM